MFKVLLLQAMRALPDERAEYLIKDRLVDPPRGSTMRFLGLGSAAPVPDANTVWTFREALKRTGAVDAPFAEVRGYDGGNRRHVAVDTDGRPPTVHLTPADVAGSAGAHTIVDAIRKRWPWLKPLFADAGRDRTRPMDEATFVDFTAEIVRRSDPRGSHILLRRWVVERTFGRMIRRRRRVRDHEQRLDVSEAMSHLAMGAILPRSIAHP